MTWSDLKAACLASLRARASRDTQAEQDAKVPEGEATNKKASP